MVVLEFMLAVYYTFPTGQAIIVHLVVKGRVGEVVKGAERSAVVRAMLPLRP
jgi:hypothetical protein